MRTIEELIQLFKDGKEDEVTEEEWIAIDEIIAVFLKFMNSVIKIKTNIR